MPLKRGPAEPFDRHVPGFLDAPAARLVDLGLYYGSPAILDEQIRMYVALGLTPGERHPDEDENILLERIPLAELTRRVLAGEIPDGKTQCAALRAAAMLADGTLSPG